MLFIVILQNRCLHTRSNAFLVSLAITDMLVGFILQPLHIMQLFSTEYSNNCGLNSARRLLSSSFMGASIGAVTVVSYDRYVHLSKTVNYPQFMSKRRVVTLLVLSWLIPLIMSMSHFTKEIVLKVFTFVYISSSIAIMIACYVTIIRTVRTREIAVKRSALSIDTAVTKETKTHIKAAKAIVLIIAVFLITFAPMALFYLIVAISRVFNSAFYISRQASEITYAALITATMASSAINPIIYYFRIPKFKASFKRYVRPCLPVAPVGESASSNWASVWN